jgi:hypothetical protein
VRAGTRLEVLGLAALMGICVAFVASFVLGIGFPTRVPARSAAVEVGPAAGAVAGRVEVLNASGVAGLARTVTRRLRDAGFDVVYYGNAAGFDGDSSVVIARAGGDGVARSASAALGIGAVRVEPDPSGLVDATVVVGRDWAARQAAPTAAGANGWRARVGRWLRPGS